ncbi:MAG: serine--tRNA ligase, partial [Acidobacteriota bacterium]
MLDPAFVRDQLDAVRQKLAERGLPMEAELDALAALDAGRRRLIPEVEELKRQQNASGHEVARAKKAGQDASHLFAANKARGQHIKLLETELAEIEDRRKAILLTIPNLPHESVPVGRTAADNREMRRWGDPPRFDFTPKSHSDLGPELGILDFERATRMSGARFAVLAGAGARLSRALIDFMLDLHTREHGYTEVWVP